MDIETEFSKNHSARGIIEKYTIKQTGDLNENCQGIPALDIEKIQEHFDQLRETLVKEYVILRFYKCQPDLKGFLNKIEKELIQYALLSSSGVQKRAAELLKVKQTCLFEKMKRFKLKPKKSRTCDHQKDLMAKMESFIVGLRNSSV